MFRFNLVEREGNYEEYSILLSADSQRSIVKPVGISSADDKAQEVGRWVLLRGATRKESDKITVAIHPALTEEERSMLMTEIASLCGKYVWAIGADFEAAMVLSEELHD